MIHFWLFLKLWWHFRKDAWNYCGPYREVPEEKVHRACRLCDREMFPKSGRWIVTTLCGNCYEAVAERYRY